MCFPCSWKCLLSCTMLLGAFHLIVSRLVFFGESNKPNQMFCTCLRGKWQFNKKYTFFYLLAEDLNCCAFYFRKPPLTLYFLIFHLSSFVFLTSTLALPLKHIFIALSHPLISSLLPSGPASLKMKHRLPSSGTSTIFMLSQTASTHSFSWSDWGLFFFLSALLLKALPAAFLCLPVLLVSSTCCVLPFPLLDSFFILQSNSRWRSVTFYTPRSGRQIRLDDWGDLYQELYPWRTFIF